MASQHGCITALVTQARQTRNTTIPNSGKMSLNELNIIAWMEIPCRHFFCNDELFQHQCTMEFVLAESTSKVTGGRVISARKWLVSEAN